MIPETLGVALLVTEAFEALGVTYAIGGSLASGVHGVVRATHDADIVADLRAEHAGGLVERLGGRFTSPETLFDERLMPAVRST